MKGHTMFWYCNPDEVRKASHSVKFLNVVSFFLAEEGARHRQSAWIDIVCPENVRHMRLWKRAITWNFNTLYVTYELTESDATPVGKELYTMFWKCTPVEARHQSPGVQFQKIVCHFWAEARQRHCCPHEVQYIILKLNHRCGRELAP